MKILILPAMLMCLSQITMAASTIEIEGLDIYGSKPDISCKSEVKTVCGFEIMKKHPNGGGLVSACAADTVSSSAVINKNVIVCGMPQIGPDVVISGNSRVSGTVRIQGTSYISNSKLIDLSSVYDSRVINSTISGSSEVDSSKLVSAKIMDTSGVLNSTVIKSTVSGAAEVHLKNVKNKTISQNTTRAILKEIKSVTI